MSEQQAVANVLLDALVALDPEDHDASVTSVPIALGQLREIVGDRADTLTPVAFGAMTLAHACISLVASVKDVDRLDVIAALRQLFEPCEV
jgi:hypothetical protein